MPEYVKHDEFYPEKRPHSTADLRHILMIVYSELITGGCAHNVVVVHLLVTYYVNDLVWKVAS